MVEKGVGGCARGGARGDDATTMEMEVWRPVRARGAAAKPSGPHQLPPT